MTTDNTKIRPRHPASRINLEEHNKASGILQRFWEHLKDLLASNARQKEVLEKQLSEYRMQIRDMDEKLSNFETFLREIPLAVAIKYWLEETLSEPYLLERYTNIMDKLQKNNIIPYESAEGHAITLDYFMQDRHKDILESIRLVKDWSLIDKEDGIRCYCQFSHNLHQLSYGLIPSAMDPDRLRVRNKVIKYEIFIDFVQHLSERDGMIAKLLYFGAPSIDEVLSLKISAIDIVKMRINFSEISISFPKHIIQDLYLLISHKDDPSRLLFTNVRGAEVERAHLNQSFTRACAKMANKAKITPGNLLRQESELES